MLGGYLRHCPAQEGGQRRRVAHIGVHHAVDHHPGILLHEIALQLIAIHGIILPFRRAAGFHQKAGPAVGLCRHHLE